MKSRYVEQRGERWAMGNGEIRMCVEAGPQGHPVLVDYAKYLLQYTDNLKLEDK